jgi:hypothetical protein
MSENTILSAMRTMAWERANGELQSMLQTYYSEHDGDKYQRMKLAITEFRIEVIDNALHE